MADGAVQQTIEKAKPTFYGLATTGGIVPSTFEDTWRIAETLAKSSLVRSALKGKPEDVMLMLMQGLELGLKPIQAITQIYVVDGVPSLSSRLKIALVRQSSVCEYFTCTFTDDTKATFETKRRGQKPVTLTFTIEQAAQYGLTSKDNWKKKAVMLRWRAAGQLCDLEYSDVIGGVQTYDEARDMRERIVTGSHIMQSVGEAPRAPVDVPEVPDEDDDQEGVFAQVARGEVPQEPGAPKASNAPSIEEQLHIQIDEVETREQLGVLNKAIGEVKNIDLRAELKKHFTRRWNDLDPKKITK